MSKCGLVRFSPQTVFAHALALLKNINEAAMTPDQILEKATEHDKGLLTPFGRMSLEVLREGDNVVVLLCDAYRNVVLMEDSGCTAKVDKNYMGSSTPPCAFTLTPAELCE
jgi:hypothetical protein